MDQIDYMIDELIEKNKLEINKDDFEKHILLKTLMTISTADLSDKYYEYEKYYLDNQLKDLVDIEHSCERLFNDIFIYQGDITRIKADAIVNAANEKMLGCFIPGHHCIDNAIHLSAGLQLRAECMDIMSKQGTDEPVGQAKITSAFNLPSKYVIHTVGPKHFESRIKNKLKSCYLSILRVADHHKDIENVVFCSISTGIYGVPTDLASEIALETIDEYMRSENKSLKKIVIDVFSKEDYDVYKSKSKVIRKRSKTDM